MFENFWIAAGAALLLGISKAGIKGISSVFVAGMAFVFGAKASTGILMPLLISADFVAVWYYQKHAHWNYIKKLAPTIVLGILIGVIYGQQIEQESFKIVMASIVIISAIIMALMDRITSKTVPSHWSFAGIMGLSTGFTTMVGNLAGAFSNLYFLAMRVPKNVFIGTAAWLFFLTNLFKVPFHIFYWKTINVSSFNISLQLVPFVLIGFFAGIKLVALISEKHYRKLILLFTALSGLVILL